MSDSPEKQAAYEALLKACADWGKLCDPIIPPPEPPNIRPRLMHGQPGNFYPGVNMHLDAGGYMPGKIPVVVVPIRKEDIRRYKNKRTATFLLRHLGVDA